MKNPERISRSLGIFAGQVSMSSYTSSLVECTAITKYFVDVDSTETSAALFPHGIVSVACDQLSDSGYAWRWDASTGCFKCFYPVAASTFNVTIISSGAATPLFCTSGKFVCTTAAGTGNYAIPMAAAAGGQVADNVNPGTINFVAVGFIR